MMKTFAEITKAKKNKTLVSENAGDEKSLHSAAAKKKKKKKKKKFNLIF